MLILCVHQQVNIAFFSTDLYGSSIDEASKAMQHLADGGRPDQIVCARAQSLQGFVTLC